MRGADNGLCSGTVQDPILVHLDVKVPHDILLARYFGFLYLVVGITVDLVVC